MLAVTLCLLLPVPLLAQGGVGSIAANALPRYVTVAQLPTASTGNHGLRIVTDDADCNSATADDGVVLCLDTGSSWSLVTGAGGGSDDQTATEVPYTPTTGADWFNPDPDDVAESLDDLAERLTDEEAKAITDAMVPNDITIDLATLATTATTANSGDTATAFFSLGTIEAARLPALSALSGAVTDAQVPNDITVDLATLATTATTANSGDSATDFFSSGTVNTARLGSGTADSTTFLRGDSTWATPAGGGGTPGGSDTQVQFNDGGAFGGDAGLTYNKTTDALTLAGKLVAGPSSNGQIAQFGGTTSSYPGLYYYTYSGLPRLDINKADDGSMGLLGTGAIHLVGSHADTPAIVDRSAASVVGIRDALRLFPISAPPVTCGAANTAGVNYFDSDDSRQFVCNGTAWDATGNIARGRPKSASATNYTLPGVQPTGTATVAVGANLIDYTPIWVETPITIDQLAVEVTVAAAASSLARICTYNADTDQQPTSLVLDGAETVAVDSTGVKTISVTQALAVGRYLLAFHTNGTPTMRAIRGQHESTISSALGASPFINSTFVSSAFAACAASGVDWDTAGTSPTNFIPYKIFLRVSVP